MAEEDTMTVFLGDSEVQLVNPASITPLSPDIQDDGLGIFQPAGPGNISAAPVVQPEALPPIELDWEVYTGLDYLGVQEELEENWANQL